MTTALAASMDKMQLHKAEESEEDPPESWEDEAGREPSAPAPPASIKSSATPKTAPKSAASSPAPTPKVSLQPPPLYPSLFTSTAYGMNDADEESSRPGTASPSCRTAEKRPEKSVAVASRLIAAGIGQRAPKRTKEQREYDQAVRLQEKKKRDTAKAEEARKKEDEERAKRAMWDD